MTTAIVAKIHLPPALAQFVYEKVESGEFSDPDALINEALYEKAERDEKYQEWAHEHIKQAFDEVKSGVAKYADFEIVHKWAKSWGTKHELPRPACT
ncbi:hypothetical protein L0Y69_03405 [bacterium]|nr:hypothetical protein [bacterium]